MPTQQKKSGCGCTSFSIIFLFIGCWVWLAPRLSRLNIETARSGNVVAMYHELTDKPRRSPSVVDPSVPQLIDKSVRETNSPVTPPGQVTLVAHPSFQPTSSPTQPVATAPDLTPSLSAAWEAKELRGIYLSRYMATNRASEQMIRDRVRYYKAQGLNTIIHGVWGNGCTMYKSEVMQRTVGYASCPNQFQDNWLDWLIDEAHKQGMQVHAYFEKGIKLDENSPIFDWATRRQWFVPGIDKTYSEIDHYLLNVENAEVAKYFTEIQAEFVQKYPTIDAVQWDDYVGYHEELPGEVDRTQQLTQFMQDLRAAVKQTNPQVSFDIATITRIGANATLMLTGQIGT